MEFNTEFINGVELISGGYLLKPSTKRFVSMHKDDIDLFVVSLDMVNAFYGESGGIFRWDEESETYKLDKGNLYKVAQMTKVVNEYMDGFFSSRITKGRNDE